LERWEIQTKLVNEVVIAYREWYRPEIGCVCNNDPDNYIVNVNGVPLPGVCSFHEWQHKRQQLQQELIKAGLSLPIPKMLEMVAPKEYDDSNPLYRSPELPNKLGGGATYAGKIAAYLAQTHIVVYLDRTKFINLSYNQRDQEVEDLMVWSPVLVYRSNPDKRSNGRDEALLLSRQYGYCYFIKS